MVAHLGAVLPIWVYAATLAPLVSGARPHLTADAQTLTLKPSDPLDGADTSDDHPFDPEARTFDDQLSGDEPSVGAHPSESKDPYAVSRVTRRPSLEAGKPDEILFSIVVTEVYGLKLSENTFVADIRLTLQWNDTRATDILTEEQRQSDRVRYLTLSESSAAQQIWTPDMIVANQAIALAKTISSTVKVRSDGVVTLIRRQLVAIKNKFDITNYPYDNQTLQVVLSSSRYMSNDVKLVDMGTSLVSEGACQGSAMKLMSNTTLVFEDEGSEEGFGSLASQGAGFSKSRGVLKFEVNRDPNAWSQGKHTAWLLAACGYLVFWTPMETRFEIRVSLLIVALLSLLEIRSAYLDELNGLYDTSLGEVFYSSCMLALFCAICFNVCIEFVSYELKKHTLAEKLHQEVRVIYPIVFLAFMGQCFYLHLAGWESSLLFCFFFMCRCYVCVRLNRPTDEETSAASETTALSETTSTGANESKSFKP